MTTGYHDIDAWVSDALERGDFCTARELVHRNSECLSNGDKRALLEIISEAEASAVASGS